MKTPSKLLTLCAVSAATLSLSSTNTLATNGFLAYGNGMVSHGVGGAGVANASEIMSAVDNPALAARVGAGWAVAGSGFNPNRSANVGLGYVDSDRDWFLIPSAGWMKQVGDGLVAGVTVSALGGMNTDYPSQLFGSQVGVDLSGVIIAPTLSKNVSDTVSVGGAVLFGYEKLQATGPGVGGLPRNDEDTATGFGIELGIVFDAGPSTTIGIDYQSKIDMDVMDKHAAFIFAAASDAQLTLPAITTIGITHQVNEKWTIMADVADVPWSDVALLDEVFGWVDQTIYKVGAEVQVTDDLSVRFGVNHGDSPIPDSKAGNNILAPATTERHYTIGFTKKMGKGSLTGYYARVLENEQLQAGAPGGLPSIRMDQNAFGIGYNIPL